jgi:Protein of unknown function (DUF4058)
MANPFPGMDPYLEGDLWPSVHADLTAEIVRQLSPQIRPKYVAITTRRIVMAPPDEIEIRTPHRLPDVGVMKTDASGAVASAGATQAPLVLDMPQPEPIPLRSIELRDTEHNRLVTAIEVLSPTNKRGEGAAEYATKRTALLRGEAHMLEIDLLRVGVRFPLVGPLPSVSYFVFLSRVDRRPRIEVWPIPMDQPLPKVPVPLLDGDPDVELDLQAALTTIYDIVGYNLLIDYTRPPAVPFTPEQAAWADDILRRAGRRP